MQQLQGSRAASPLPQRADKAYILFTTTRRSRQTERNREMAKSFLRTALDNLVEARQRRADLYATGALLSLDDASLKAMGLTRDELRRRPSQRSII
jgi:DNA phosphorothioation-dependent restriction protein DptG